MRTIKMPRSEFTECSEIFLNTVLGFGKNSNQVIQNEIIYS